MIQPPPRSALADFVRQASHVKTNYDIWRENLNIPEGGEWVRVVRKRYDRQENSLVFTLADGTDMPLRGTDPIRSRRLSARNEREEGLQ